MSDTPRTDAALGSYECLNPLILDFARRLELDIAMLIEALRRIDRLNVHTGDGPHCTCCQGAREITVRDALFELEMKTNAAFSARSNVMNRDELLREAQKIAIHYIAMSNKEPTEQEYRVLMDVSAF